jgi:lipoprotein-releasing system ATP-binding protein
MAQDRPTTAPGAPVIELRGVSKTYGGEVPTKVLFDVDLTVMPGEFVAVVGASGSGKTTLLNIIGLLDAPSAGEILIGGQNVSDLSEEGRACLRREYLGFIFQFHYLLPQFDVLENVLLPCRLKGRDCECGQSGRMQELLRRVGLEERMHYGAGKLSGGQQQRAAIIRSLANDPVLVLADEPTGNLDSASSRAVFDLMRELNRTTNKAFLMVTHDEALAHETDRVVTLVDGRVAG